MLVSVLTLQRKHKEDDSSISTLFLTVLFLINTGLTKESPALNCEDLIVKVPSANVRCLLD